MAAGTREYRQRIKSVKATKKITKAMELIAASRVIKARTRVAETSPYARALTKAVSAVATNSNEDHPLTTERENRVRAAVVVISSDRGLAGAYPAAPMKFADRLTEQLRDEAESTAQMLGATLAAQQRAPTYLVIRQKQAPMLASEATPLLPGDVIFTGTPSCVGMGRTPQRFLTDGDVLTSRIADIGEIEQRFVATAETR